MSNFEKVRIGIHIVSFVMLTSYMYVPVPVEIFLGTISVLSIMYIPFVSRRYIKTEPSELCC